MNSEPRKRVVRRILASFALVLAAACGDSVAGPEHLVGTYTLVEENGDPLPSDPSAPFGCCLTLSGSLVLTATTYDLGLEYRNKNNGIEFGNSEQGTWSRDGSTLTFVRTGGGGEGFPFLLGPGTISGDGRTLQLLYGDEGPGSDQTRGSFRRNSPP
ncbi:MAG TPA: lipocalin family protein [Gemmatimonadales bacterium]|nr:lipocalin family protein [Gemmatimonadales bacterium]